MISCSSSPETIDINQKPINEIPITQPERPATPKPVDVKIRVLTGPVVYNEFYKSVIEDILEKNVSTEEKMKIIQDIDTALEEDKVPFVYYGFNESDYLDFSQWLEDVYFYNMKNQEIILYYEDLTEDLKVEKDKND